MIISSTVAQPKSGDIWLVRFHPSIGGELKKYRPAIIINSLEKFDPRFSLIIPLSTNLKQLNPAEIAVTHPSLDKPSLALCWYLITLDRSRLQTKLGTLEDQQFASIKRACDLLT